MLNDLATVQEHVHACHFQEGFPSSVYGGPLPLEHLRCLVYSPLLRSLPLFGDEYSGCSKLQTVNYVLSL